MFGSSYIEPATKDNESPLILENQEEKSSDQAGTVGNIRNYIHDADFVFPSRRIANDLIEMLFRDATIHWIDRLEFMKWHSEISTDNHEAKDPVDEQIKYATLVGKGVQDV